ncbi:aldo/keto reductase [Actimicrobium antarcticum]|uniref:Aldo/keto reductase n=1 Tax=Actimicrobium antarcticum TaxID=1051899 RepID=A0ABP7SU62_9BURK
MHYKNLGKSNLKVSALCLGTMMFGDQTEFDEAERIVASAREHGINFIDTADVYMLGRSEEMVGKILASDRHDWVLATKLGNPMSKQTNQGHYSRNWILRETEASLKRLGTDFVDILYLHRDYHDANLEEAVRALGDLIRDGKIRAFGLSNFRGWRIAEVVRLCEQTGVPLPIVCQPYYNMLNRGPEVEILPACAHYGIGVVPYSPIARGVLTGKYLPGQAPAEGTRAGRGDTRMMNTEFREESLVIAQQLKERSDARGITLGQFATAWVMANKIVSSVIAGPRTLAQLEDYYPAIDVNITTEEEAYIDTLIHPGHTSTPGYTDPNYPFFGR